MVFWLMAFGLMISSWFLLGLGINVRLILGGLPVISTDSFFPWVAVGLLLAWTSIFGRRQRNQNDTPDPILPQM